MIHLILCVQAVKYSYQHALIQQSPIHALKLAFQQELLFYPLLEPLCMQARVLILVLLAVPVFCRSVTHQERHLPLDPYMASLQSAPLTARYSK